MRRALFVCLWLILSVNSVHAVEVETLFMPGDVIKGHEKLEKDCKNCHVRLRETTQVQLCLDCHEKVDMDIKQKKGFHGLEGKAANSDCKTCHTEHKGRTATMIRIDKDRFNHLKTDFKLRGKHLQTECQSCHKPDEKYREALSACIDCHKEDDVHKEQLGDKCNDCHTEVAWSDREFDHDSTGFKLRNAHKVQQCESCHIESQYKDTPNKCISCHAIKDVHNNRFGDDCKTCHGDEEWSKVIFDHNQDTSYELTGKHRSQNCLACHSKRKPEPPEKEKAARDCYSCHKLDDVHRGSNGKKCQQCHSEDRWSLSSFDHDKETEFPLIGRHGKVNCQACHIDDSADKKIDRDCYSCHKNDDVHDGQQGKVCDDCHSQTSWLSSLRFDHDLSDFPLIGQHAVIGCESCHLSSEFKTVESKCKGCHQSQDIHKGSLGKNCQRCHNSNDWLIWEFDHSQTDFDIKGAHRKLHCHQCHVKPLTDKQSVNRCVDCHLGDDIHSGGFGKNCDSCHIPDDFSTINVQSLDAFKRKAPE